MKSLAKIRDKVDDRRQQKRYQDYVKAHELTDSGVAEMRSQIDSFQRRPVISIVLPVFDTDERWLKKCIDSVRQQIYPNWQLCIADDRSSKEYIRPLLQDIANEDDRVHVVFRDKNGHISAASNSALSLATGEFIALLDHDDELSPDALFWIAKEINDHRNLKLIYTDEDVIDERGRRHSPKFKPDLSRDLIMSVNYINHLSVYRRDVIVGVGGFRTGFEGSQDFDLLLRVLELVSDDEVRHFSRVLYHWRAAKGSVAASGEAKSYAHENARRAIREHLLRMGGVASVKTAEFDLHRVSYELPGSEGPSILHLDSTHIENSVTSVNRLVFNASEEILCFTASNLEPLHTDWITELVGFAIQNHVGVVGGRIVDRDDCVVDGGFVIGTSQLVSVAFEGRMRTAPDTLFRNCVIGNYSAVSLSCFAVRRELFRSVGGFDEKLTNSRLLAADLCLRLRDLGYRIVLNPFVEFRQEQDLLYIPPSASESSHFRSQWEKYFRNDPFYNRNLSYEGGAFKIKA